MFCGEVESIGMHPGREFRKRWRIYCLCHRILDPEAGLRHGVSRRRHNMDLDLYVCFSHVVCNMTAGAGVVTYRLNISKHLIN
jgi:hypothetical protein